MAIKTIRFQVSDEEEVKLQEIAEPLGCVYRGRLSISRLMGNIANNKLKIVPADAPTTKDNTPLIELTLKVIAPLNGSVAVISREIGKADGSIYGISAKGYDNVINISLSLPNNIKFRDLFNALKSLNLRDILSFNEGEKIRQLMEILDPLATQYFNSTKDKESRNRIINQFTKDYSNQALISHLYCTMAFRIWLENKPGRLGDLALFIAKHKISIISVEQDLRYQQENTNIANIKLGFTSEEEHKSKLLDQIESLAKFTRNLSRLEYVRSVKQIKITSDDNLH